MTAIVGIHEGDALLLASDGMATSGKSKCYPIDPKIFLMKGYHHVYLAFSGDCVIKHALLASPFIIGKENQISYENMVNRFIPRLYDLAKANNFIQQDEDGFPCISASLLILAPAHLYYVSSSFVVREVYGAAACGTGGDIALSYLLANHDETTPLQQKVIAAIQQAITYGVGIDYPIFLVDNKSPKIQIIQRPEIAKK